MLVDDKIAGKKSDSVILALKVGLTLLETDVSVKDAAYNSTWVATDCAVMNGSLTRQERTKRAAHAAPVSPPGAP